MAIWRAGTARQQGKTLVPFPGAFAAAAGMLFVLVIRL